MRGRGWDGPCHLRRSSPLFERDEVYWTGLLSAGVRVESRLEQLDRIFGDVTPGAGEVDTLHRILLRWEKGVGRYGRAVY